MKRFLVALSVLISVNTGAYNVLDVNGESFCEARENPSIAIKVDYEMGDYGRLENKVLKLLDKKTGEISDYKFLGRSGGYSLDVYVNENSGDLPSHIGLLISRSSSGISLFEGFDNLGNLIDERQVGISYSISVTYRPWESCGNTDLNPEK